MLALVASITVSNTALDRERRGWFGQGRPWPKG